MWQKLGNDHIICLYWCKQSNQKQCKNNFRLLFQSDDSLGCEDTQETCFYTDESLFRATDVQMWPDGGEISTLMADSGVTCERLVWPEDQSGHGEPARASPVKYKGPRCGAEAPRRWPAATARQPASTNTLLDDFKHAGSAPDFITSHERAAVRLSFQPDALVWWNALTWEGCRGARFRPWRPGREGSQLGFTDTTGLGAGTL